jgi:hypothetical protein
VSGEVVSDTVPLREHLQALREADLRFDAERDRRLTEVAVEREKALKIKEEADKTALGLQRDNQIYKDEKANELRSQIERERGSYATQTDLKGAVEKMEALVKPIAEFVSSQQGGSKGMRDMYGWIFGGVMFLVALAGLYLRSSQ